MSCRLLRGLEQPSTFHVWWSRESHCGMQRDGLAGGLENASAVCPSCVVTAGRCLLCLAVSCVVQRLRLPVQGGDPSTRLCCLSRTVQLLHGAGVQESTGARIRCWHAGVLQGPCLCVPATYSAAFQARRCCLKGLPLSSFVVVGTSCTGLWLCMLGVVWSRPSCILYMYMLACASLAALFPQRVSGQQPNACNRHGAYRGAALLASLGLSHCQFGAVRTCRGRVTSGCGRCGWP